MASHRRPKRARILSRSWQVVAATLVAAVILVTVQQLWLARTRAIDDAIQQLTHLDMVLAEQAGLAVETVDLILRTTMDPAPERVRANQADIGEVLRRRIAGVRQISALAIADPAGNVVAASRPDLLGPLQPAGMAAVAISRLDPGPGLRISEPLRDPDGRWTALMTRRLTARDGQFAGIVIAYLNLAYFEDFFEAVELHGGSILLHLRNGTVLARYPGAEGVIGSSYAKEPPFAHILAHALAGSVVMASPLDGSWRILSIRALKSFPLAVSVSVDEQRVLAGWWTEVWVFGAAALFGSLGIVGALLHLSRQARDAEVAARLRTMHELARIASLDALTGLLNRTTLTERLERLLAWGEANNTQVALLFLDLDGFKQINDVQGHKSGDAVLRVVAARIAGASASTAAGVARWGGDEFVIIIAADDPPDTGAPSQAVSLAAEILREVCLPVEVDGQTVRLGGTIGLAIYPQDGCTPDALVSAADAAMYAGKQSGGNVVRIYDAALAGAVAASADLERDLRQAMQADALYLVYQPIIEMPGERCAAFEALVRWRDPVRGNVPPAEFIPVAEHAGLIGRLGQWVLERACQEAAAWQQDSAPAVSVNVSLAQVISGELQHDVARALQQSGLPAHQLHLELTESLVGADHLRIVPMLQEVRRMGVRIALDDFGTGFSSLSRLRDWPVSIVKIDKSFVRAMARDGTAVIRATLLVAREYGLYVTAEGVETVEQWRELTGLGVHSFQGFLFSRPLEAADVPAWLDRVSRPVAPRIGGLGWSKLEHSAVLDEPAARQAGE